jgi:hypothetical protein
MSERWMGGSTASAAPTVPWSWRFVMAVGVSYADVVSAPNAPRSTDGRTTG